MGDNQGYTYLQKNGSFYGAYRQYIVKFIHRLSVAVAAHAGAITESYRLPQAGPPHLYQAGG